MCRNHSSALIPEFSMMIFCIANQRCTMSRRSSGSASYDFIPSAISFSFWTVTARSRLTETIESGEGNGHRLRAVLVVRRCRALVRQRHAIVLFVQARVDAELFRTVAGRDPHAELV